jgi:hypothetical protein
MTSAQQDERGADMLRTAAIASLQVNAGIAKLTVGRPEDDAAIVPVVSESSAKFVEGLVMDAKEKGATLCQEYKREVGANTNAAPQCRGVPVIQWHRLTIAW